MQRQTRNSDCSRISTVRFTLLEYSVNSNPTVSFRYGFAVGAGFMKHLFEHYANQSVFGLFVVVREVPNPGLIDWGFLRFIRTLSKRRKTELNFDLEIFSYRTVPHWSKLSC